MKKIDRIIWITVFICGATLMALEIAAGRTLAPHFGNTIYVWGSIIGIFLLSLGLGYYLGGKQADKKPSKKSLSYLLIITAVLIIIIPYISEYLIGLVLKLPNSIAPLLALLLIFFLPGLLHGFVSPYAIRLSADKINEIGRLSGRLYSISTIGSVVGTFLTTFILILIIPIDSIYFLLGVILLLNAFFLHVRSYLVIAIIIVVISAATLISNRNEKINDINDKKNSDVIVSEIESLYGQIQVRDSNGIRSLYVDGGKMMQINLDNRNEIVDSWEYIGCMEFPFLEKPDIKKVLSMGLGGGQHQKMTHEKYNVDMDVVEINEDIVKVAEKYFDVQQSNTFRVWIEDARAFLNKTDEKYDLIVVDIFHYSPSKGHTIPSHLVTEEFFNLVKGHLSNEGIFAMNFASRPEDEFFLSEYKTISSVFNNVYAFNCGTQVLFATNLKYDFDKLKEEDIIWGRYYEPELKEQVLTDDYSPINYFKEISDGNKP